MRRRMRDERRGPSRTARSATCARRSPTSRRARRPRVMVLQRRAGGRPQTERAVDVQPRAMVARDVARSRRADRTRRCSRCRPARTRSSVDRRCRRARARARPPSSGPDRQPSLVRPGATRSRSAAARAIADTWTSSPTMTRSFGACCRPSASTSQPGAAQQFVARGRQRGEVRHAAAGHKAGARGLRQAEQLEQPPRRDFFDDRGGRRHHEQRAVLIPRGGEPLRRHRRRQGAAGDEPEVARSGRGHETGFGALAPACR